MSKSADIPIKVTLDESKIPPEIKWTATDAEFDGFKEANAFMLSLWDEQEKNTMGIDLWTKQMTVQDMVIFFHQKILKLAETYERATNQPEIAEMFNTFAEDFAKKAHEATEKASRDLNKK